jgi:hypothetical protein
MQPLVEVAPPPAPVMVESWAGPVRVEWDVTAPLTPFGQLPFFIQFLKVSGFVRRLRCGLPAPLYEPERAIAPARCRANGDGDLRALEVVNAGFRQPVVKGVCSSILATKRFQRADINRVLYRVPSLHRLACLQLRLWCGDGHRQLDIQTRKLHLKKRAKA